MDLGYTDELSGGSVQGDTSEPRLAKSCARCRQQKLACKPGKRDRYPCSRCESLGAQCVLVERARAVPGPTLSERVAKQEDTMVKLQQVMTRMSKDVATLLRRDGHPSSSKDAGGSTWSPIASSIRSGKVVEEDSGQWQLSPLTGFEPVIPGFDGGHSQPEDLDVIATKSVSDGRKFRTLIADGSSPKAKRPRTEVDETAAFDEAFECFVSKNLPALCFFDSNDAFRTPADTKSRSHLLFWSIMAVGSRERESLQHFHVVALTETMQLLQATVRGGRIGFWDLCGAMVYNRYLAPITPIGHLVDLAYSLDLDRAYANMRKREYAIVEDARNVRLWVCILGQDIFHSSVNNRPPHYPHTEYALEQARWLASSHFALPNDRRLLATYEFEKIIHSVLVDTPDSQEEQNWDLIIREKCAEIEKWYRQWEPIASQSDLASDADVPDAQSKNSEPSSMLSTLKVNSNLAKFTITSRPLRGVKREADLNEAHRRYVLESVRWARALCRLCTTDFAAPSISFVGETTLFAFAWCANFIMKVTTSLFVLPDIDAILTEIDALIVNFRSVQHSSYADLLQQSIDFVRLFMAVEHTSHPVTQNGSTDLSTFAQPTEAPPGIGDMMAAWTNLHGHTATDDTMPSFQNLLGENTHWDPTMAWWLPMAQGGGDWPWEGEGSMF